MLLHFGHCVESLKTLDKHTQGEVGQVLNTIVRGQRFDIERFQQTEGIACLQTVKELDDYLYSVAGCVGEFWTRICHYRIANYSSLPGETLYSRAVSFGKGLQLVNILRDLPVDIARGRHYIPQEQPGEHGLRVAADSPHLKPPVNYWWKQAVADLQEGWQYMLSINNRRIRSALALPLLLGFATLQKLSAGACLTAVCPVKVSRRRVRLLMMVSLLGMISPHCFSLAQFMNFSHLLPKKA